ncbi:MAG: hypothetical protein MUF25_22315 [Pirellulaceae bacterium]|nr:hypothetical protein [Pirellulaceae bacterium]
MSGTSAPRPAEPSETGTSIEHQGDLGRPRTPRAIALSDAAFFTILGVIGGVYVLLILALLAADAAYMVRQTFRAAADAPQPWIAALTENPVLTALSDRKIQYSIWLSMISCTLSAILSLVVAVPLGYLMARHRFWGQRLLDAVLDIPIVLPPRP